MDAVKLCPHHYPAVMLSFTGTRFLAIESSNLSCRSGQFVHQGSDALLATGIAVASLRSEVDGRGGVIGNI